MSNWLLLLEEVVTHLQQQSPYALMESQRDMYVGYIAMEYGFPGDVPLVAWNVRLAIVLCFYQETRFLVRCLIPRVFPGLIRCIKTIPYQTPGQVVM